MGVTGGHVSNFYIVDLENFATASRRYTGDIYPQVVRRPFVYDTYKTMKATRTRHGWVHMLITHRHTSTLQLHNFDLFRTCRRLQVVSSLLRGNWQDFNWHDASRGPSAISELLVGYAGPAARHRSYRSISAADAGAKQQTRQPPIDGTDRQTDGRTPVRYADLLRPFFTDCPIVKVFMFDFLDLTFSFYNSLQEYHHQSQKNPCLFGLFMRQSISVRIRSCISD